MHESLLSASELKRYSRQIILQEIGLQGQEILKKARVLCIGLGGLGSPLTMYAAAAGIGNLGLMDDDCVEESNLQRQLLYQPVDVSRKKVSVAAEKLRALNPELNIEEYPIRFTRKNGADIIRSYDIVADCSDNFETHYLIHDLCREQEKPCVVASVQLFQGYCTVFHGSDGPCYHCLFPKILSPTGTGNGIAGVMPGIMGIIQATEILKFLLQIGRLLQHRLLRVDLLGMHFQEIQLQRDQACGFCAPGV